MCPEVTTKEGLKRIDEVKAGDYVLSKDVKSGEIGYKKVNYVYIKNTNKLVQLIVGTEEINTTSSHLFFTDSGWWKSAKNITVGDRILTSDGELKEVTAIRVVELEEAVRIYNLNVEDYHTYFVGVSGLLVHNDCTAEMMYAGREAIENARRINIDDPKILSQIGEVAAKMVDDVKVMKKYIIVPENGFQAFVERKYIEIRKVALNDVADVAHNTGLPIQDIIDMKNHLFLNTHKISVDGKPLETLYFQGDADIAYGWQVAQTRKLTDAEKEWFIQLRNHELLEKKYMDEGMPLRDPSTWNATTKRFDENPVKNAHDKAALTAPNPRSFPGYDQSKDLLKYFDDDIYY